MLCLLSMAHSPTFFLGLPAPLVQLFFKLPTFLADVLITGVLRSMFPGRLREILIFYVASPIVLYGCYMHSQLDLIPTAFLTLSVYLLTKGRMTFAAAAFGAAISTKFHVVAALPLFVVYMHKTKKGLSAIFGFLLVPAVIYLATASPYLGSEGYLWMVLKNPKQMSLFDVYFSVGEFKLYLPIFISLFIYARFVVYNSVNSDLFHAFLGILFSVFVLSIVPAPAWYVWIVPFLSIFFIKYYEGHSKILYLHLGLSVAYLLFFVFFYRAAHHDLNFLSTPVDLKIPDEKLRNIAYAGLEVALASTLYTLYKLGVRSNLVYRKDRATLIGISGDSAAGKSTLMSDLKAMFGKKLLEMEGDADHKWERGDENWRTITHLNPKANLLHRQADSLMALKSGLAAARGEYDHSTGKIRAARNVESREIVALSGLHPFFLPIARKTIDIKIYLDTDERLRRHWKIIRDVADRGHSKTVIQAQLSAREVDAVKFIHPQKNFADLAVSYFTTDEFEVGDLNARPRLQLKVRLNSSVQLEGLVYGLADAGVQTFWDYEDDLKNQFLILPEPAPREVLLRVATQIVPNMEELIPPDCSWQPGFRGFLQLVVLILVSHQVRLERGRAI